MRFRIGRERIKIGTIRKRTRFLLFPKCIDGNCRWLEIATWEEQAVRPPLPRGAGYSPVKNVSSRNYYWEALRWRD